MPRRIKIDVEAIRAEPGVESAEFNSDEESVGLRLKAGASFNVIVTDDYPRGDSFFFWNETQESGRIQGNLETIYRALFQKVSRSAAAAAPSASSSSASAVVPAAEATSSCSTRQERETGASGVRVGSSPSCDTALSAALTFSQQHSAGNHQQHARQQQQQAEQQQTRASSSAAAIINVDEDELLSNSNSNSSSQQCDEGEGDHDYSYFSQNDDGGDFNRSQYAFDTQLERDIQFAKQRGFSNISVERVAIGCRVSIDVPCRDLVADTTAKAFGFDRDLPLVVQLRFERPEYLKVEKPPEVFVFQGGKPCRFGQQVRNFVAQYLDENWTRSGWVPPKKTGYYAQQQHDDGGDGDEGKDASSLTRATTNGSTTTTVERVLSHLNSTQRLIFDTIVRKGHSNALAAAAALQSRNLQEAYALLAQGTVLSGDDDDDDETRTANQKKSNATAEAKQQQQQQQYQEDTTQSLLRGLKQESQTTTALFDPHKYVDFLPDEGFLCHIAKYVQHRIPTSPRYCVICDKKHLVGASMFKPSVCERMLCSFRFHQLKMGADATDSVATGSGIIDLLIAMFRAAVESQRRDVVVDPYPSVPDPDAPGNNAMMLFDPNNKDFEKLLQVTKDMPKSQDFVESEDMAELSKKLVGKNRAVLPLIEWIISSNRSHLVKLFDSQQLPCMQTKHQFLLVTSSPEKQLAFEKRKKDVGTVFAWHGSRIENWHAVLRQGLRNMSGTKQQMHGAVHGSGIYVATSLHYSLQYAYADHMVEASNNGTSSTNSRSTSSGNKDESAQNRNNPQQQQHFFDGSNSNSFVCVALCEIIAGSYKDHGWCWTIENEDAIMTRFFFVFTSSADVNAAKTITTKDESFVEQARALVDTVM